MSEREEMPPMNAELRARLREAAGMFDEEASSHAQRAFARVARALPGVIPAPAGGDGGNGEGGGGSKPTTHGGADAGAAAVGDAPASGGAEGQTMLSRLAAPVIASVIFGASVGAAVTYALVPVRARIVYVDRPIASSVLAVPPPSPPPMSSTPISPLGSARSLRVDDLPGAHAAPLGGSAVQAPASPSARVDSERLLLDEARAAFASGDHAKALALLRRHHQHFRGGVLSEERDALTVRTLAALGRKSEVMESGHAFVARYPQSIMRPAVESAMAAP